MKYWIISPGKNAEAWPDFVTFKMMGIGYAQECIGDISKYSSKEEIDNSNFDEKFNKMYDESGRHPLHRKCCWQFAKEINIGDIVFAKDRTHKLCGYGIVKSNYIFNKDDKYFNGMSEFIFPHIRIVDWVPFEERRKTDVYLDRKTLKEIKDESTITELCEICNIKK